MADGEPCVPGRNAGEGSGGYRFIIWEKPNQPIEGILVELGCTSDTEAYVLAMQFLRMVDFKLSYGQLKNWKGESMMYYNPKKGWYFGNDRDLAVP